ncbi:MAG: hypothetical protein PHV24_05475 [Candidatus Kapabacteria bacterium]|nr:hypothetical protein [Candidatus Kapabacteria bacterium]
MNTLRKIIALLLLFSTTLLAGETVIKADNISIIRQLDTEICADLAARFKSSNLHFSSVNVSEHSSRALFVNLIRQALSADSVLRDNPSSPDAPEPQSLEITISDNNVYYDIYPASSDSVVRRINVEIIYLGETNISGEISRKYLDTLAREDVPYIERSENNFARGVLPVQSASWLDEYLTPIVVVGASILAVVLFFTVRSK